MRVVARRRLLFGLLVGGCAAVVGRIARAANLDQPWPRRAFESHRLEEAATHLFGAKKPTESAQITLDIPDVAEDGAAVPVSVTTTIDGAESIVLLAEKNPTPLLAEFLLSPELETYVATRVKLGASGAVVAVVRAHGRTYSARKTVRVGVGGCG